MFLDTNKLEDWSKEEVEPRNALDLMRKIPMMDMDNHDRPSSEEWSEMDDPVPYGTRTIGWHFDGLSRGMHMEIKYDDSTTEFSVLYKGYIVYKEVKGELAAYVPIPEWEGWIDRLHKSARDVQRKLKEEEFESQMKSSEKAKSNWLRDMASKWGLT